MAGIDELRTDEWIAELEEMGRMNLFNAKEIKSIIARKKQFAYKLQRRTHSKNEFLKYVRFEMDLHRIIKSRRHKRKIFGNPDLDAMQLNRMKRLLQQALLRYDKDINLLMLFFISCDRSGLRNLGSQMLGKVLQLYSNTNKLWSFAAKWDFEKMNFTETARRFLLSGLREESIDHRSSKSLYEELFKLEKKYAHERKNRNTVQKMQFSSDADFKYATDVANDKLCLIMYRNTLTEINKVDVNNLGITGEYSDINALENKIFSDLVRKYSEEKSKLSSVVEKAAEVILYENAEDKERSEQANINREMESKRLKEELEENLNAYEDDIRKLNSLKMWDLYLQHLIIIANKSPPLPNINKLMGHALEGAITGKEFKEKYFLQWIDALQTARESRKSVGEVLIKSTEIHPHSLRLWRLRLRFHIARDEERLATKVFQEAIEKISNSEESVLIWRLMIQYYHIKSPRKVVNTFRAGIERGGAIALKLKPMYLQWVSRREGVSVARKLFETPEMLYPPSLELITEMISIECMQAQVNVAFLKQCHEMACDVAGKDNIDVWVNFFKFELEHGTREGIQAVFARANRTLNPGLAQELVRRYNDLTRSYW